MQTATKTISHYVVMGEDGVGGYITLEISDSAANAIAWRDEHNLKVSEVWAIRTDATSERIA